MQDEGLSRAVCELGLQIAIDGPAGAGKSTIGRALARALDCPYLDTGLMYRAVTLAALERNSSLSDGDALGALARTMTFQLRREPPRMLLINGEPPSELLHSSPVDEAVSQVSAHAAVRREMVARQRELAGDNCIVMIGRDIGTTVLPDAPLKLWITATPEERASRRRSDRGPSGRVTTEDMLGRITRRDAWDADRPISPLRQAPDAMLIDNSSTPDEAVQRALAAVRTVVQSRQSG